MPILRLLTSYIKRYKPEKKALYLLSIMFLFWALYEGSISYMTPLIISERGVSEVLLGIIIGTSSIAGAFFDFIICHFFRNAYYKRVFMVMFALCLVHPFILSQANTFVMYILAMAIWGVYYDLRNIGTFDFMGRHIEKEDNVSGFGLMQIIQTVGFLIGPILSGFLIAESFNYQPLVMAWIFLVMAVIFFFLLYITKGSRGHLEPKQYREKKHTWQGLLMIWGDLGKILFPVLIFTLTLSIVDAFFWTLGPIFAESLPDMNEFAGLFMTAYSLPSLLVGWLVGSLAHNFGKKRTAFVALLVGSCLLSLLPLTAEAWLTILLVFVSSMFVSISWPAISGAYADYISETPQYEKEISGLQDFFSNLGYVVGPILAGFVASKFGNSQAFSILGVVVAAASLILLSITPENINVNREMKKLEADNK